MTIILTISKFVSLPILTDWTVAQDILSLDTAFCNCQRCDFLHLINGKNGGVFKFGEDNLNKKLKWICKKNLNVLHLTLNHPNLKSIWTTQPEQDISRARMLLLKFGLKSSPQKMVPFSSTWEGFQGASKVTSLNLSQCFTLSDFILIEITKNCTRLQRVDLSECSQITDKSVIYIASRNPTLQHINLSECHAISDKSILGLTANCKQLTHIDTFNCYKLTDTAVNAIAQSCPDLQHLNLGVSSLYLTSLIGANKSVTVTTVDKLIAACQNLKYLNVDRGVDTTLSTVSLLSKCVDLEVLHVGGVKLECEEGPGDKQVSDALNTLGTSCPHLQVLHISDCKQLSDDHLAALLTACKALTSVSLINFCEPNADETYSALCNCSHLTHLNLTGNVYLLDSHMSNIMFAIGPQLITLILKDCNGLAYVGFPSETSSFCENLTVLDLSGIRTVNDRLVAQIATRCRKLTTLLLHQNTLCYERGFKPILTHLSALHTLSIVIQRHPVYWVGLNKICERYGAQLTSLSVGYQKPGMSLRNTDIASIAKHCRNLTSLELTNFNLRGVTQSVLKNMFKKCTKLRKLNFANTDITHKTITHIAKHCHALFYLNLSGCLSMNNDDVSCLSRCDSLTYLVLSEPYRDVRIKYGERAINELKERRVNLVVECV